MSWFKQLYFKFLYFRKPPWDTQVSPPELLEFIETHPPGRALDLGCGTGTNVITLAKHGWQAFGIDFVKRAIARARVKAEQAGVTAQFFVGDVIQLNGIEGLFDLVLDIGCFHSLNPGEKRSYAANLERITQPGSTVLMYGFLKDDPDGGPGMDVADLVNFEAMFDLVKREEGTDRGERRSVWLTYERHTKQE
jgi:SAM-dependent methyltransferase